jgi:hypothetical protein
MKVCGKSENEERIIKLFKIYDNVCAEQYETIEPTIF